MEDPKAFVVVLVSIVVGMVDRVHRNFVVGFVAMALDFLVERTGTTGMVGRNLPQHTSFLVALVIEDLPSFLVGYIMGMVSFVDIL